MVLESIVECTCSIRREQSWVKNKVPNTRRKLNHAGQKRRVVVWGLMTRRWHRTDRKRPVCVERMREKGNTKERRGRTRYSGSLCNCPASVF